MTTHKPAQWHLTDGSTLYTRTTRDAVETLLEALQTDDPYTKWSIITPQGNVWLMMPPETKPDKPTTRSRSKPIPVKAPPVTNDTTTTPVRSRGRPPKEVITHNNNAT